MRTERSLICVTEQTQKPERRVDGMCEKKHKTINVKTPEELRKLISEIPEGTVYSLKLKVILTNERDDRESE